MNTFTFEELTAQKAEMLARLPVVAEEIKALKKQFYLILDSDLKIVARKNIGRVINLQHRIKAQISAINAEIKRRNISRTEQAIKAKQLKQCEKCRVKP